MNLNTTLVHVLAPDLSSCKKWAELNGVTNWLFVDQLLQLRTARHATVVVVLHHWFDNWFDAEDCRTIRELIQRNKQTRDWIVLYYNEDNTLRI